VTAPLAQFPYAPLHIRGPHYANSPLIVRPCASKIPAACDTRATFVALSTHRGTHASAPCPKRRLEAGLAQDMSESCFQRLMSYWCFCVAGPCPTGHGLAVPSDRILGTARGTPAAAHRSHLTRTLSPALLSDVVGSRILPAPFSAFFSPPCLFGWQIVGRFATEATYGSVSSDSQSFNSSGESPRTLRQRVPALRASPSTTQASGEDGLWPELLWQERWRR